MPGVHWQMSFSLCLSLPDLASAINIRGYLNLEIMSRQKIANQIGPNDHKDSDWAATLYAFSHTRFLAVDFCASLLSLRATALRRFVMLF